MMKCQWCLDQGFTRRPASNSIFFAQQQFFWDQLLQTAENKLTVLILVFKEFLQTSIWPVISVLYAKGYHDFPSKLFCLTIPKNFVGKPFGVSENFWSRKILCFRGLCHDFRFSVEKFLSNSAENLRTESFIVALFSGTEKVRRKKGGEYQDFPSSIFCLTVPKKFVGESFTVALNSGSEKVYGQEGGVSRVSVEIFLSHSAELFAGEPFCAVSQKISGSEKVYG